MGSVAAELPYNMMEQLTCSQGVVVCMTTGRLCGTRGRATLFENALRGPHC
jgi:hypothetical protein